jgi:thiamine kinase-like enzyme
MIPENKQAAVRKALQHAFGVTEFEDIRQLLKGLSTALIYKITVQGNPYLLRVIIRTDAMADPSHYYGCMEIAAKGGIAPRIHYTSIEDRVSITDFINEQPFPMHEARKKMARLLQRLHRLPTFPFRINYFDTMDGYVAKFRSSNILPGNEAEELYGLHERVAKIYPHLDPENMVSSHNDLKPENIIFDGIKPWPVDWEAAFLNDRYLDLAVVANFVVKDENDEADYLGRYFGEPADEDRRARFFLAQQLLHIYYFAFFMTVGAGGKTIDPGKIDKACFRSFHDRIWNGGIDLADNNLKLQYAWVHMTQALRNAKTERFENALRIVSACQRQQ